MTYRVRITETCVAMIQNTGDRKIQRTLLDRIEGLSVSPGQQGKKLVKDLSGYRSIHAAGRYRVIYKIREKEVVVYVVASGIRKEGDRKDVYRIARKLLKAGLLSPD